MSLEAVGIYAFKTVVGVLFALFLWVTRMNHKKLQDTYTKEETSQLIDLKIEPLQKELNLKIDQLISDTLIGTKQREETNEKLGKISTGMEVLKNEVGNLKERILDK